MLGKTHSGFVNLFCAFGLRKLENRRKQIVSIQGSSSFFEELLWMPVNCRSCPNCIKPFGLSRGLTKNLVKVFFKMLGGKLPEFVKLFCAFGRQEIELRRKQILAKLFRVPFPKNSLNCRNCPELIALKVWET